LLQNLIFYSVFSVLSVVYFPLHSRPSGLFVADFDLFVAFFVVTTQQPTGGARLEKN
jgi:hypothetical protein